MSDQKDPNIFQIVFSILSSFFGVTNKKDFERTNAYIEKKGLGVYIIIGFVLAVLAVLTIIGIVKLVLANVA